jgi:hypothetical protein
MRYYRLHDLRSWTTWCIVIHDGVIIESLGSRRRIDDLSVIEVGWAGVGSLSDRCSNTKRDMSFIKAV